MPANFKIIPPPPPPAQKPDENVQIKESELEPKELEKEVLAEEVKPKKEKAKKESKKTSKKDEKKLTEKEDSKQEKSKSESKKSKTKENKKSEDKVVAEKENTKSKKSTKSKSNKDQKKEDEGTDKDNIDESVGEEAIEAEKEIKESDNEDSKFESDKASKNDKRLNNKKDKVKKIKKPLTVKAKIIILSVVIGVVLCAISTVLALYLVGISKKIETPTISVTQLTDRTYVEVEKMDRAEMYEYVITPESNGTPFVHKSKLNYLGLNDYLNQSGSFEIKVRCLGKTKSATSNYSESEIITNYMLLSSPTIFVNGLTEVKDGDNVIAYTTDASTINDDSISWASVENASKYYIYYGVEDNEAKYIEVTESGTGVNSLSLKKIYEKGVGLYNLSISAIPNNLENPYLKSSMLSNTISVAYSAQYQQATNLDYDSTNKYFYFDIDKSLPYAKEYMLTVKLEGVLGDGQNYVININELDHTGSALLTYSVDLSSFVTGEIAQIVIYGLSDGIYSENSEISTLNI